MNRWIICGIVSACTFFSLSCTDENKIAAAYQDGKELSEGTHVPFLLHQNYPNPFNPTTIIPFELSNTMFVTIKVLTEDWQEITTLVHNKIDGGRNEVDFDGSGLPSGEYYYSMEAQGVTQIRKMKLEK